MAIHSLRLLVLTAVLTSTAAAGGFDPPVAFFEEVDGRQAAWRTIGSPAEATILQQGFILRSGDRLHRFRWDESMRLETLRPEEVLESSSYLLTTADGAPRELRHARRIRASNLGGSLSVVYYFSSRGFEFDIEVMPGAKLPSLSLESLDGVLSISGEGGAEIDGEALTLRPVAYSVESDHVRRPVDAAYVSDGSTRLRFAVGPRDPSAKLVIDPVITYASYFGGTGGERAIAIKELGDGSLLILGNSEILDMGEGISLTAQAMSPQAFDRPFYCFLAKILPRERRTVFIAYMGAENTSCRQVDVDAAGRILVAGGTSDLGFATPGAPYSRLKQYLLTGFLSRLSADGKRLEKSTYLPTGTLDVMRVGPGEAVYFAVACPQHEVCTDDLPSGGYQQKPGTILLGRYDMAANKFDAATFVGGGGSLSSMDLSASGLVYVFGNDARAGLPLKGALQAAPANPAYGAPFVVAFSANLRTLAYGTYFAGFGAELMSVELNPDGSIWIVGNARQGTIPNLSFREPNPHDRPSLFAIRLMPGENVLRQAFWPGGTEPDRTEKSLLLPDGRICFSLETARIEEALPGAAMIGDVSVTLLACLDASGSRYEVITPIAGWSEIYAAALARNGGIWTLGNQRTSGDLNGLVGVPYELKTDSLQPVQPFVYPVREDLLIRHISLETPGPALTRPNPLRLTALKGRADGFIEISGLNFSFGMELAFDNKRIPLQVSNAFNARLFYRPELDVRPGQFEGRLVIPIVPGEIVSEPFLVEVRRMPPASQPFFLTSEPTILYVREPLYPDSIVRWNGNSLPLIANPEGEGAYVVIPPSLMQPGEVEAALINPSPGGGIQRQPFQVQGSAIFNRAPDPVPSMAIGGGDFAVDRSAGVVYTAHAAAPGEWIVQAHRLTDGSEVEQASIIRSLGKVITEVEVSSDGKFVYLLDDQMVVTRLRTNPLRKDLEIMIPADGLLPVGNEYRWRLKAVHGQPESFVISTLGRRLVIYDGQHRRPYTTAEFPAPLVGDLEPLLATGEWIYARHHEFSFSEDPNPCIVRYRIDSLGFAPGETFCNLNRDWGKYPEMKRFGSALFLQYEGETVSASVLLDNFSPDGAPRLTGVATAVDLNLGLAAHTQATSNAGREFRLHLTDSSGADIGSFPRVGTMPSLPVYVQIVGETLIVNEIVGFGNWVVRLFPQWRSHAQWYDEPAPIRSGTIRPTYRGRRSAREPSLRETR